MVAKKVGAIQRHSMTPIVCVGETLEEREAGETEAKVLGQIRAALNGLSADKVASLVVAYEPIWAIGTGRTATADDAQQVCATIRGCIAEIAGAVSAAAVRIQYGGSVKSSNIAELIGTAGHRRRAGRRRKPRPRRVRPNLQARVVGRGLTLLEYSARLFEQSE